MRRRSAFVWGAILAVIAAGVALPAAPAHADAASDIRLVDQTDSFVVTGDYIAWRMGPTNDGQTRSDRPVTFTLQYDQQMQPPTPDLAHAYSDLHFIGPYAGDCSVDSAAFTASCTLPALQPGATEITTLVAKADLGGIQQSVTGFTATVGGASADDNPANNVEYGSDITLPKQTPIVGALMSDPGTMHGGSEIDSPNGQYRLVMQSDGNLVEYGDGRALWASGTAGNPGAYFVVEQDGTARVFTAYDTQLWVSSAKPPTPRTYPQIGVADDGDVSVFALPADNVDPGSPTVVYWQNHAPGSNAAVPVTTLRAGQGLHAGSARFVMQSDGNLVDYVGTRAVWSTRTNGHVVPSPRSGRRASSWFHPLAARRCGRAGRAAPARASD